jgi:hypothetical protein
VVLHHGREGGGGGRNEARPSASTACWTAGGRESELAVARWVVPSVLVVAVSSDPVVNVARKEAGLGGAILKGRLRGPAILRVQPIHDNGCPARPAFARAVGKWRRVFSRPVADDEARRTASETSNAA